MQTDNSGSFGRHGVAARLPEALRWLFRWPLPGLLLLSLLLPLSGPAAAQSGPGPGGPGEVGVITLERAQVPYSVILPGRAVAYELADIRPRVGGMVESVDYQPGHDLQPGDVMFHLEADSFEAALAAAEAQRDSALAGLSTAESRVERDRKLAGVGSTQANLESSEAALAQARAALQSAEAQLKLAQLDLDRVVIRSPIEGVGGLPLVTTGALVTANQVAALAQVVRLDPIYVDVSQSSARMLRVRERIETGDLVPGASLQVSLTLESGETHSGPGRFVSPGTQVSTTTGSIDLRFEFDNPDRKILPGQFLRVTLTLGTSEAILVPQRATRRQPDGSLTAFVVRDGRARQVTLGYSGTHANAWVVTGGVEAGDRVIVDGLNNLRDGAEVSPVAVTIDAQGVVHDVETAPDAAGVDAVEDGAAESDAEGKGAEAAGANEAGANEAGAGTLPAEAAGSLPAPAGTAGPGAVRPDAAEPGAAAPDVAGSGAARPDAAGPDTAGGDASAPDAATGD